MQGWGIVLAAIAYLLLLFVVASYGDRRRWISNDKTGLSKYRERRSRPAIYALSLAIYCTSWTFFGSVGFASVSGFDFLAIYLGPVLMITVGYRLFTHVIDVSKSERITSIADFVASRYGKSTAVGAVTALIAVLGIVPYIALQLKAISVTVDAMIIQYQPSVLSIDASPVETAFIVAIVLAIFTMLFGTRHADATEHQDGLMMAVATESVVKLLAFLTVGVFVTFFLFDGFSDLFSQAQASGFVTSNFFLGIHPTNFVVVTLLSFCAFVLLPRQFHVGVVENQSRSEVRAARWMFPLYLIAINLFVIPIALAGMLLLGTSVEADSYVLALPLAHKSLWISFAVFIGGLSAATAMVIVASVALSIMISNNLILPVLLWKWRQAGRQSRGVRDMVGTLLHIRRTAILVVLGLAFGYYKFTTDTVALASIGLLSFAAVAQFAPSFFIGLFWRRATSLSALWGMIAGFSVWFYTLLLPTLVGYQSPIVLDGPFGIGWLRPQALFGLDWNSLNHGVIFSLAINTAVYFACAYIRAPKAIERLQAGIFSIRERGSISVLPRRGHAVTAAELNYCVANYLGLERANRSIQQFFSDRDLTYDGDELADDSLIAHAEQILASAIGGASSRLVISLLLQKHNPEAETTAQLLDDASEAIQYNRDLLQAALDQVEQGISVFDRDFRLSSWNRQFRLLLDLPVSLAQVGTSLNAISRNLADRSTSLEQLAGAPHDLSLQLLQTDNPSTLTLTQSGRILEISTRTVPDGGIVISWNDTTERATAARDLVTANETLERRVRERTEELTKLNDDLAAARESAEAANVGKTKFLAATGHDILQPLNAARLYTSSLVEQLADSPSRVLASNVDSALESVEDILGTVLAISRLDSGVLAPNITRFPVARLLAKLELEFRPVAEAKGLKLEFSPNGFHVESDYSLLRRLLQNLISNAIKYTRKGKVSVDARVVGKMLQFSVTDTGIGIAESDQGQIFDEFLRLDEGKQAAAGLGLGLSIVRRLAITLSHDIDFSSQLGVGSTFTVTTPLAIELENEPERPVASSRRRIDLSSLTIVCLDNEALILSGMRVLLEGWGCTIHTYESAAPMLVEIKDIRPDIILADYHLDRGVGLDAITDARDALGFPLPAALITADRSSAVRKAASSTEVTLMNKPLRPAALRTLLTALVRKLSGEEITPKRKRETID